MLSLKKLITEQQSQLKDKEIKEKEFYAKFKELFNKRNKVEEEISGLEAVLKKSELDVRDVENKINNISLDKARITSEISALEQEYEEYKDYAHLKGKTEQELSSQYSSLNTKLLKMGSVNMRALEIYEKVEKEYNMLMEKKAKLISEKDDILMMMNEIETKKKDLFIKSFDTVNNHFKNIFGQLSSKGDAYLVLENEDSPFEGGVRINVRISGKKFLDIRSLSGGEKTMTSLAFIFAIQEDDPASFYVLDEVDAALDKRNSEKLSELIKKYCDRSQYIVISHNDGIISSADTLYGVSMDHAHGISKVVSLKI